MTTETLSQNSKNAIKRAIFMSEKGWLVTKCPVRYAQAHATQALSFGCHRCPMGADQAVVAETRSHGTGRKERTVPLWPKTAQTLRPWFQELDHQGRTPLAFPSIRHTQLSRDAVEYCLRQAVARVVPQCP